MKKNGTTKLFQFAVAVISAVIGLGIGWAMGGFLGPAEATNADTPQLLTTEPAPVVSGEEQQDSAGQQNPEGAITKKATDQQMAHKQTKQQETSESEEDNEEPVNEQIKREAVKEVLKKIDEVKGALEKQKKADEERIKENPWHKIKGKKPPPPDGDLRY